MSDELRCRTNSAGIPHRFDTIPRWNGRTGIGVENCISIPYCIENGQWLADLAAEPEIENCISIPYECIRGGNSGRTLQVFHDFDMELLSDRPSSY